MAVPKKKTSKSKRNMRRAHDALGKINVVIDKESGEYRLPHHMCTVDNTYNSREVLAQPEAPEEDLDE